MGRNAVLAIDVVQEGSAVEVRDIQGCKGVFANDDIENDSIIFHLKGIISSEPTKFTIQIDGGCHLTLPAMVKTDDEIDYWWQYQTKTAIPGCVNAAELRSALRDIAAGEEINFNYLRLSQKWRSVHLPAALVKLLWLEKDAFLPRHRSWKDCQARRSRTTRSPDSCARSKILKTPEN